MSYDFRYGANPSLILTGPTTVVVDNVGEDLSDCGLAYAERPSDRECAYERARTQLVNDPRTADTVEGLTHEENPS